MGNVSRAGSCDEPGCDEPVHARRMCKLHYSRWYYHERQAVRRSAPEFRPGLFCAECGQPVPKGRKTTCSRKCQKAGERKRYRAKLVPMDCAHCGETFMGRRWGRTKGARYCSLQCDCDAKRWRFMRRSSPIPWADCKGCGKRFVTHRGKLYCSSEDCYYKDRPGRPAQRFQQGWRVFVGGNCCRCGETFLHFTYNTDLLPRHCSRSCAKADDKDRRRAAKANTTVGAVVRHQVFERDDWTCRLCGEPVDKRARVPHHHAATIDHIVPLAKGGQHTYSNVQCAHFICNTRKGASCDGQLSFAA